MATPKTQAEKQQMMTNEPIPKLIIKMSIPTVISMLITSFYSMADTYFVGQIGTEATAAVGVVFPLMAIIQAFGFFFGHGSGNAISRKLGSGDVREAEKIATSGIFSGLFAGVLICVLGTIFAKPFAYLLGSTDSMLPYTLSYLRILLIGAPFLAVSFVINNQMRFQGSATLSMIGVAAGSILNVALDPLLIFVFDMGVAGAAWATVVGQITGLAVLVIGYVKAKCVTIRPADIKTIPSQFREITAGGLPSLFRQGLASVATVTLNNMAAPFGAAAIAAMSVVTRVTFFANSVVIGFGQGFQPVCGFNYGAENYRRVKDAFWFSTKITTGILFCFAIVGFLSAENLVELFRDDPKVVEIGKFALRCNCITLPLTGWITMTNMLFQTCKWTLPATILASARQGLFLIPSVVILSMILGLLGIQISQPVADIASFITATVLFVKLIGRLASPEDGKAPIET